MFKDCHNICHPRLHSRFFLEQELVVHHTCSWEQNAFCCQVLRLDNPWQSLNECNTSINKSIRKTVFNHISKHQEKSCKYHTYTKCSQGVSMKFNVFGNLVEKLSWMSISSQSKLKLSRKHLQYCDKNQDQISKHSHGQDFHMIVSTWWFFKMIWLVNVPISGDSIGKSQWLIMGREFDTIIGGVSGIWTSCLQWGCGDHSITEGINIQYPSW